MMRLMKMNVNSGGVGVGGLDSVMTPLLPGDPSPSLGWPSASGEVMMMQSLSSLGTCGT